MKNVNASNLGKDFNPFIRIIRILGPFFNMHCKLDLISVGRKSDEFSGSLQNIILTFHRNIKKQAQSIRSNISERENQSLI